MKNISRAKTSFTRRKIFYHFYFGHFLSLWQQGSFHGQKESILYGANYTAIMKNILRAKKYFTTKEIFHHFYLGYFLLFAVSLWQHGGFHAQ